MFKKSLVQILLIKAFLWRLNSLNMLHYNDNLLNFRLNLMYTFSILNKVDGPEFRNHLFKTVKPLLLKVDVNLNQEF